MAASIQGPLWERDEEFRQSVIRKALLLGFTAEEYDEWYRGTTCQKRYRFTANAVAYGGYISLYAAAYDFLRVNKLEYLAGDFRG